jgi:hypothetical protein
MDNLNWFVVFNGTADTWLWSFQAERWDLHHPNPGYSMLAIVPRDGEPAASIEDARWLADVLAFDHDAPIGISPAWDGNPPDQRPVDPAATPPALPVGAEPDSFSSSSYWEALNASYNAAAQMRFSYAYALRYDDSHGAPSTDFATRFADREELIVLYAMAARQPDLLSEYLCLYRLLEAADDKNGKTFSAQHLSEIATRDFGALRVVDSPLGPNEINAFEEYRTRASAELKRLAAQGDSDVPDYLYRIRNSLAHGKHDVLTPSDPARFENAAKALPIVKLLARMAVEP